MSSLSTLLNAGTSCHTEDLDGMHMERGISGIPGAYVPHIAAPHASSSPKHTAALTDFSQEMPCNKKSHIGKVHTKPIGLMFPYV